MDKNKHNIQNCVYPHNDSIGVLGEKYTEKGFTSVWSYICAVKGNDALLVMINFDLVDSVPGTVWNILYKHVLFREEKKFNIRNECGPVMIESNLPDLRNGHPIIRQRSLKYDLSSHIAVVALHVLSSYNPS